MADSLDIDEVNRTRIALGMAPIPTSSNTASNLEFKTSGHVDGADEDIGSTLQSREAEGFDNFKRIQDEAAEKKRREARREALKKERDATQRYKKLAGRGLGEADEAEMDTKAWLLASRKRQKKVEKERARALERELAERENQAQYTEKDLAGLKVGHELGDFEEGMEQIITLKDQAVDAESDEDVLENAELTAREKLAEKLQLKKKKPVYDPNAVEESGSLLAQYDEEIEGKKIDTKRFTLDGQGRTIEELSAIKDDSARSQGMKFSLDFLQEDKPVADYVDISEIKIRKMKKKKDKSKRQKAEDDNFAVQEAAPADGNVIDVETSSMNATAEPSGVKRPREETSYVDDDDLRAGLDLQRRAALKKRRTNRPEYIAAQLREEASATSKEITEHEEEDEGLVIDDTTTFIANLQKPKAPVQSSTSTKPNAAVKPEILEAALAQPDYDEDDEDVEMPESYDADVAEEAMKAQLKLETSTSVDGQLTTTGLDEEGTFQGGMGAALALLRQRNLLKDAAGSDTNARDREKQRFLEQKLKREAASNENARLQRERDRASGRFEGMSAQAREQEAQKQNKYRDQHEARQMAEIFNKEYKPNFDLKHLDEHGRELNQKEAFKVLSHQFHGKGSGKQKTEKMLKKIEDEKKMEAKSMLDSSQSTGMNSAMGATARKNRQAGVRLQ